MNTLQRFFVLEGLDGAGTTTQRNLFAQRCRDQEIPAHTSCEPTENPIGKLIRAILNRVHIVDPMTLARLYSTDRYEHIHGKAGIIENLETFTYVLSDRYFFSSLAYQSIQSSFDRVYQLNKDFPLPEICFFIDIDPQTAMKRLENRSSTDIFEYLHVQEQVYANYQKTFTLFSDSEMKIVKIDGTLPPDEISEKIWKTIQQRR